MNFFLESKSGSFTQSELAKIKKDLPNGQVFLWALTHNYYLLLSLFNSLWISIWNSWSLVSCSFCQISIRL